MPHILIPRAHLFGNPSKISARISPDGHLLAWLAPVDGVLNVWVGPSKASQDAQPVTNERKRGIRFYRWTYDGRHLVYLQDEQGNENFHVYAVDPQTRTTRDLTPLEGVSAMINRVSRTVRDRILVGINQRDPKFHDLHSIDLATGNISLQFERRSFNACLCATRPGTKSRPARRSLIRSVLETIQPLAP